MSAALRAEWTKLTAIRTTHLTLLALFGLTVALSVLVCAGSDGSGDTMELALGGIYVGQFAAATLGVRAISAEFATGMIRTTFTALPRRTTVLAAKALVVFALVFAAGLLTSVTAVLVTRPLLPAHAPAVRPVLGAAAYLALLALFSLGIGAIIRQPTAALATALGVLIVPTLVIFVLPMSFGLQAGRWCPMFAGLAVLRTVQQPDSIPISPGAGIALFAAYAAVALAAGLWLVARRGA